MNELDHTHEPGARSWVRDSSVLRDMAGPHLSGSNDFPLQNLPYAIFRRRNSTENFRGGVAIEAYVVDLAALSSAGVLPARSEAALACEYCKRPVLNDFMALGWPFWRALRHAIFELLHKDAPLGVVMKVARCLIPQRDVEYALPARIGDYTDFYTSIYHARNIGRLRNPDYQVPDNFLYMPIAYHGRSSTIRVSGQPVRRPNGQRMVDGRREPECGRSEKLDYELELGVFVGPGNEVGSPIPIAKAEEHIFGLTLLNDWSARDIQFWESTPLGPFLAKNFATTISPWVVTLDALAPYRRPLARPIDAPKPLDYLSDEKVRLAGSIDLELEVWLEPKGGEPQRLSRTSFRHQYWSILQMVAHHTIGGCSLRPGDLLGTGTISGPEHHEAGAFIELTKAGRVPVLGRSFLQDGDTVHLRSASHIGFGECSGSIVD